jgi:hypothetical protein
MNLSSRTITALAEIITGDGPRDSATKLSPYRTLGKITDFFRDFGERDLHPSSGAPSPQQAGAHVNTFLKRDGYEVVVEERYLRMAGDHAETEPYFVVRSLRSAIVASPSLIKLSEESITEHVAKAKRKIEAGDPAGAIASAYTLVEEFLKLLLRKTRIAFNENEGDIRALYKLLAEPLHLAPKNDTLESYLKAILEGLQRQIGGLFELANKASDRHARKYNPASHHARLAVNVSFTLCEFLLESYEYQQKREERRAS